MLDSGTVLEGRYAIMDMIGRGGMSTVYLGHLLSLQNKRVAIKEVAFKFDNDEHRERAMKRFRQEATLLATLDHPNLVHINDYFHQGDNAFLVCDYVEGTNLRQLIDKTDGFLPLVVLLRLFKQLCDVLDYCHQRPSPVIFRDLKPENVMINAEGQVKLIDFGIAGIVDPGTTTASFLKGTGTHGYAPIEQYMPSPKMDATSDIYSLGATLYTMLTRQTPPSSVEIATGQVSVDAPDTINPEVTPAYSSLVRKMMQMQKSERYQSIAEVREALEKVTNPPRLLKTEPRREAEPKAESPAPKNPALYKPKTGKPAPPPAGEPTPPSRPLRPEDDVIGGWRKKRHCPKCGSEGRHGTEVCLTCGQSLRRRSISLHEPMHAKPTAPLVLTREEIEREQERSRPPLDFRVVPADLRPVLPQVKASIQLQQGLLDYITARDNQFEEVVIKDLGPQRVHFQASNSHAPGTVLAMRLAIPVVAVGERLLVDAKVHITETSSDKHNQHSYAAEFKGLTPQAVRLLESLQRQERRAARRFVRTCQVVSKDLPNYKALTTDISAIGMGFLSNRIMPVDGIIELILDPDDASSPQITALSRIIHCREATGERYRVGVGFVQVSDKSARILHDFLKTIA